MKMSSPIDSSDEPISASEPARSTSPRASHLSRASSYRGRDYNLYDAVAGQVTLNERVQPHATSSRRQRRPGSEAFSARNFKLAPEDVLFRRHNAPTRYAEHDIYWASEDLVSPQQQLPESDLLKSVHCYASKFYDYTALSSSALRSQRQERIQPQTSFFQKQANPDLKSLDETALLAFGVLLEEASREVLGKRGDLVFTEAEGHQSQQPPRSLSQKAGTKPTLMAATPVPLLTVAKGDKSRHRGGAPEDHVSESEGGPKKKRKVARNTKDLS
ncbi:hypothetical protein QBC40DRAFT_52246 [Triangularia verruculosa]|uniref:Uncharacterized protein n=1 Tax=Triangularia verruculosa TaxID=2587418 RepID=A0AAN6XPN3_9PEZI|nr:hypothetical protein QBC40DRAFT_52246 [Triangularia verruculosa]